MGELLGAHGRGETNSAAIIDAVVRALREFLAREQAAQNAFDLLAIDALITRALEQAADPNELEELSDMAFRRLIANPNRE
jgi:hypothetical protein